MARAAWDAGKIYILGLIGWAIIAANYPIDWRLPAYAGF